MNFSAERFAFLLTDFGGPDSLQSYTSKGIGRQGVGSFCKEFLCFKTMPFRPMPLLVHS